MVRITLLTILMSLVPFSFLWAQAKILDNNPTEAMIVLKDYGLLLGEYEQQDTPDSMPIYNPKDYDAKIRVWSPPFEWFNSMPVIGSSVSEKKADYLNFFWIPYLPDLTHKKGNQYK